MLSISSLDNDQPIELQQVPDRADEVVLPTKHEAVLLETLRSIWLQSLDQDLFWFPVHAGHIHGPLDFVFKVDHQHVHDSFDGHIVGFKIIFSCQSFGNQLFESFVEVARAAQGTCVLC